ncbi:MAG TPA: GNAT family N-acetyltransferase [Ktedonobacterales bacterium]|jgi:GNAT superfamily N-acetyltransferase
MSAKSHNPGTIRPLHLEDVGDAGALIVLQRLAYRREADLIGSDAIPPLHESLEALQNSGETFFGYEVEGQLVGAASYKRSGALLDIHRMMVHPAFVRRGIARALLRFVEGCEPGSERVIVSTGSLNTPALALYQQQGFVAMGQEEVVPGLWITHLEKRLHQEQMASDEQVSSPQAAPAGETPRGPAAE